MRSDASGKPKKKSTWKIWNSLKQFALAKIHVHHLPEDELAHSTHILLTETQQMAGFGAEGRWSPASALAEWKPALI